MNHKKVLVLTGALLVAPHVLPADAQPSRRKQKSYAQAAAAPAQTPSKKYTSRDALLDAWVERHAARQAAAAAAETDGWSPAASSSNVTLGDFGPKNDLVPASEETEPVRTQPFPPQGDAPATTLPVDTPAQAPKVTYAQVYAYLTDAQKKALEKAGVVAARKLALAGVEAEVKNLGTKHGAETTKLNGLEEQVRKAQAALDAAQAARDAQTQAVAAVLAERTAREEFKLARTASLDGHLAEVAELDTHVKGFTEAEYNHPDRPWLISRLLFTPADTK